MGDLQVCSRLPNGVVTEDRPFPVSLSPPLRSSNLDPSAIGEDRWAIAEETTREVIGCIHPTLDSEEKRKDVIDYVQRLIRCSLGCEVFPYGSVPLKTYLPDGDIDLTALSSPAVEECLARDVLAVLQGEEQNNNAEYEVMDTQFIDAEVKLVKCLVQNIVIDISFNQLGGLCTLCFLEQVDRLVGKDHLFKRSILLIKTWCYYESRVLGAHHGLISTYALETLILYIFHLFHRSLNGPLAVLFRFLDYFSKFDWENFCISLKGPVRKSSLPDIIVEMPANMGDDLMLSEEFLRNCTDMFSVPSRELETNQRAFPLKNLNIIDPLKENNNLGRSVHRGNFYRICSAFKLGARKLGQILLLPRERTADEIKKFFSNTLGRHGCKFGDVSLLSHSRTFSDEKIQLNLLNLVLDNNIPGVGNNEPDRYSMKDGSMQVVPKMAWSADGNWVSGSDPGGEVSSRIVSDASDFSLSSCDLSDSLSGLYNNAACFPLSGSSVENGKVENEMFCEEWLDEETDFDSWDLIHEKMDSDSWMEHRDNHSGASNAACSCNNYHEGVTSSCSGISSPDATFLESLALDCRDREVLDIAGSLETFNPLSDLSGDYDSHIRSLLYGQCCHGYALSALVLPNTLTFPSYFQTNKQLDACSQTNSNGVVLQPTHNALNNHRPSNSLISEEKHKVRGTGTYFPKSNGCSCRGRSPQGRGRNQAPGNHRQFQRHSRNNGSAPTLPEKKSTDEGTRELRCGGKSGLRHHSPHFGSDDSHADGFSISPEKLQFGSLECLPEELSHPASETCRSWGSTPSLVALKVQSPKAVPGNDQERVAQQPFQLKNEDDFPPLTI